MLAKRVSTAAVVTISPLIAEIRALQAEVATSLWKMGRAFGRLFAAKSDWEPRFESWDRFTRETFQLTGAYVHKLIEVTAQFSEAEVAACGTAKLIRILPVPEADRAPLVEYAKSASLTEVRAKVNRFTVGQRQALPLGAVRETQPSQRRSSYTRREITHLDTSEIVVALYRRESSTGRLERCKRPEDKNRGRLMIGGKAYSVEVRRLDAGLVVAVSLEAPEE